MKKIYSLFTLLSVVYFSNASDYYWVNGTGYWSDYANHWATTSGGNVFHVQRPTSSDNVYFDANSFSSSGDTVYFYNFPTNCQTLDFTGVKNFPVLFGTQDIGISGSLIVPNVIIWDLPVRLLFQSPLAGNIIDVSGIRRNFINNKYPSFQFDGTGSWELQSDLIRFDTCNTSCGNDITINNGTLISNGHAISCVDFVINSGKVLLKGSEIDCKSRFFKVSPELCDFDSTSITCFKFDTRNNTKYYDVSFRTMMDIDSCTFHDIQGYNIIDLNHSTIHNAVFRSMSGRARNSFNKITASGTNFFLEGDNTIDTLIFNNPGNSVLISDSQIVTKKIIINSTPNSPITFSSGLNGMLIYHDTLCTDYISVKNVSTGGGGQFFAGEHSIDLGGTNGWNFTSCAPTYSNVWPGDANYDLVVDNIDLLSIGIAYGDTGYVRPSASNNFTAQPCLDWFFQFINGVNVKKADSDGNGLVDVADTLAVSLNYGLTHPFRLANTEKSYSSGVDLVLEIPGGQISPGSNMTVPVFLGTSSIQAEDVYGIAFTVNYDHSMIEAGTMSVDFSNSWLDVGTNHMNMIKDFSSIGRCDVAFTRIDGVNVTGNGLIGSLNFKTSSNASGYLDLSLKKIKAISQNEIEIPINARTDSTVTGISEIGDGFFTIYPNPSTGYMKIYFKNNNHNKYRILIYDSQGKIILNELTQENNLEIVEKYFSAGIYLLSLTDIENGKQIQGKIIFN